MLRPDRLGLVGCLLYLHCHLYFRTAIAQEDTRRRPKDGNLADLQLATL